MLKSVVVGQKIVKLNKEGETKPEQKIKTVLNCADWISTYLMCSIYLIKQ